MYQEPYKIVFDTTKLEIGTYIINITLQKQFYAPQALIVRLTVEAIPTYMLFSFTTAVLEYGETIQLLVWYIAKTDQGEYTIGNAFVTYIIMIGNRTVDTGNMQFDSDQNAYVLVFNSTLLTKIAGIAELPAIFSVYINATKTVYAPQQNKVVTIRVNPVSTFVSISKTNITTEWGSNLSVSIEVRRNITFELIDDVNVSLEGLPADSWVIINRNGTYVVSIDTSLLDINTTYFLKIGFYNCSCAGYVLPSHWYSQPWIH